MRGLLPIPLQLIASLLVGLGLALAAHRQAADGRSPFTRDGLVPLFYQLVLVTPAVLYLGLVHTAWSWLYLVEPDRLPFGIVGLAVVGTASAEAGGYLVGWTVLRLRRRRELAIATAALGFLFLIALFMLRSRVGHAGTFAEFAGGVAPPLGARKLGWAVVIIDVGLVAGLILSVGFLVEEGERDR